MKQKTRFKNSGNIGVGYRSMADISSLVSAPTKPNRSISSWVLCKSRV